MKVYLHGKDLLLFIAFIILTVLCVFMMQDEHFSIMSVLAFCLCLFFVGAYIVRIRKYWNKETTKDNYDHVTIIITDNEILFPNGYYFTQSPVHKQRRITVDRINEVNTGTIPTSIVIDGREVIFITYALMDELINFARKHNIRIVDRYDIWSAINEVFLDTEVTEEDKERIMKRLEANGVSREEATAIRKKIRVAMFAYNYYLWEWVNLDQQDYLQAVIVTPKKYWWSMEIALRNYRNEGS